MSIEPLHRRGNKIVRGDGQRGQGPIPLTQLQKPGGGSGFPSLLRVGPKSPPPVLHPLGPPPDVLTPLGGLTPRSARLQSLRSLRCVFSLLPHQDGVGTNKNVSSKASHNLISFIWHPLSQCVQSYPKLRMHNIIFAGSVFFIWYHFVRYSETFAHFHLFCHQESSWTLLPCRCYSKRILS